MAEEQLQRRRETSPRLNMKAGSKMLIRFGVSGDTSDGEIQAELIGLIHYEFLILRLPALTGLRARLTAGNTVTVRFINDGAACVYRGELLSHVIKPALMIFISYPEFLDILPLRQHKRLNCTMPALIRSQHGDIKGFIADLSGGGCRIVIDTHGQNAARQLAVGNPIVIQISLRIGEAPVSVSATLRSIETDQFRFEGGVSFDSSDEIFQVSLAEFMENANLLSC